MAVGLPEIGIRLSGALAPRRCVALTKAAEAAGLASVWFAENPFQRGVMATAGACTAATERVRIGVGVANPYGRHPTLIAMDFAALDELSGGRAILGIGSGIAAAVRRMGFIDNRPVTAVREAIAVIRAMLAGDPATVDGKVFAIDGARLGFPPPRRDPPIYMAAAGEPALRVCGLVADGLIVSNLTPPRTTARLARTLRAAAEHAGRPMPRVVQYVPCAVGADGDAARVEVTHVLGDLLTALWPSAANWPATKEAIVADSGIPREEFAAALDRLRRGENQSTVLDARYVSAFAIAGTSRECLRQIAAYRGAGVDELALTFAGPDPEAGIAALARVAS
jgi:5,10-methylenetetrahydromethanopterin reductase